MKHIRWCSRYVFQNTGSVEFYWIVRYPLWLLLTVLTAGLEAHPPSLTLSSVFVRIGQSFHAYFHYEIVKIHNPHCWIKSTGGGTANS